MNQNGDQGRIRRTERFHGWRGFKARMRQRLRKIQLPQPQKHEKRIPHKRWTARNVGGAILITAGVAVCLLAMRDAQKGRNAEFAASGRENDYTAPALPRGTIPVNEAEIEDLIQLPGVGETLAQAILDERALHGPFYYPEDLMAAKGIGQSKLEGFRDLLDLY